MLGRSSSKSSAKPACLPLPPFVGFLLVPFGGAGTRGDERCMDRAAGHVPLPSSRWGPLGRGETETQPGLPKFPFRAMKWRRVAIQAHEAQRSWSRRLDCLPSSGPSLPQASSDCVIWALQGGLGQGRFRPEVSEGQCGSMLVTAGELEERWVIRNCEHRGWENRQPKGKTRDWFLPLPEGKFAGLLFPSRMIRSLPIPASGQVPLH